MIIKDYVFGDYEEDTLQSLWQRRRIKSDSAYQANQKQSQTDWLRNHGDYWKQYRAEHPEKTARNRALQKVRDKRRHSPTAVVGLDASMIAKMDAIDIEIHLADNGAEKSNFPLKRRQQP
jgi:hypothetical protein